MLRNRGKGLATREQWFDLMMNVVACAEDLERVQELQRRGTNVNMLQQFRSREGGPILLHQAIEAGRVEDALALLAEGADIHAKDEGGWTALHWACLKGFEVVVNTLVDDGCSVNEQDRSGRTPLMMADVYDHKAISMYLLRHGASCKGLTQVQVNGLFYHACCECDLSVVNTLHKDGCSFSILSTEEQEGLLHHAFLENDFFVVHALLNDGCRASILSREEQEMLLQHACHNGDVFVARTLLKNGCRVSILSREEQERLVHCALYAGDLFVVHALLKDGCSIIRFGVVNERLLRLACSEGDAFVVEAFLANGCDINCVDSTGVTPVMVATVKNCDEVVKKLLLAGANLGMQTTNGDTALHLAASHNSLPCWILLVKGGARVRTKNNLGLTPLDLASAEFKEAIKEALSFTIRKGLCIIGNSESGKSTLIAALQAESNSFLGKIVNRIRRVDDLRQRTAGIETVPHCSQRYGEVLFFDFAGQHEYHGPHQIFLESLLSKPGVSMTLLLVVKMTEEEDAILHQLHRWLTPVALMATPASPPHIIIIGSFLDKVKSKEEAIAKLTRCIEATRMDLKDLSLEFVGSSFLNCHQPQSNGIDQICAFLQNIPIPELGPTHALYSFAWVLFQIRSFFTAQAVQLKEFSKWVQDNKDNLPQTMPSAQEVCQDLSAAGHALYLPNRDEPPRSWLVLDLPSILHDVYGTLFSNSIEIVNSFGLIQRHRLADLFPHLDLEMVQQLLISLEFCLSVDPSVLKVELSELTQSKETRGWLFFPALISAKPPQTKVIPKETVHYLCWELRTAKKHSISARLLQTILLRLAAHFVVKHHLSEGAQQFCCSVWQKGIKWQSKKGVDVSVNIIDNRVIQVISASIASADESCQYLINVISDILSTVHQLSPKLVADCYIMYPPALFEDSKNPDPQALFPVADIQSSIQGVETFCLSLKGSKTDCFTRATVSDLFGGCTPSLEDIERINWPQPDPSQPEQASVGNSVLIDCKTTSGARALLDVSSTPDMRDMDELVVTEVAANWQRVALWLGVEGCVSEIIFNNIPNDCERACRNMLERWLRRDRHTGEKERTWYTLLTALGRAGFEQLRRSLRRDHFKA